MTKSKILIGIEYGLSAIKNIGENSILDIVKEREKMVNLNL